MSKGNTLDDIDFGNDLEFQESFNRNIDKVLSDVPTEENELASEATLTDEINILSEDTASPMNSETAETGNEPDVIAVVEDNENSETADTREDTETVIVASDEEASATLEEIDSTEAIDETLFDINNS